MEVAETAAEVAQAAQRGGLLPMLLRATLGRWRLRDASRQPPEDAPQEPAGLLPEPRDRDDGEGGPGQHDV